MQINCLCYLLGVRCSRLPSRGSCGWSAFRWSASWFLCPSIVTSGQVSRRSGLACWRRRSSCCISFRWQKWSLGTCTGTPMTFALLAIVERSWQAQRRSPAWQWIESFFRHAGSRTASFCARLFNQSIINHRIEIIFGNKL